MAVFFFFMSAFFGLAVIHPFVTYPLSLRFFAKRPIQFQTLESPLTYAICVCAYNEESIINEKAQNLIALKKQNPSLEILIYVDCASDKTADILEQYKNDFFIHVSKERHGKTYGMNLLVEKSKADVIIFTDANVMVDPHSIQNLEKYFSDPDVGCVCGHLKYINAQDGATAATGSFYWVIEEAIKQIESDTGSVMGADGSIFAIRRSLHTPPPIDIIDDMFVSFSILCNGHRIVRAPDVMAFEKSVTSSTEEFKRKVRISCQAFNVHRLLWPKLKTLNTVDLYKYVSHKLIRWFGFVWISLSVFFFILFLIFSGLSFLVFVLCVLGLNLFWCGHFYKISFILKIIDILASYFATLKGIWKSMLGERFQTWSPAQSIRINNIQK